MSQWITCDKCGRKWEFMSHYVGVQECPHCLGYGSCVVGKVDTGEIERLRKDIAELWRELDKRKAGGA